MKISFAVAALLANVSAINFKSSIDLKETEKQGLTEENRYIGSDGKPINLAQTTGHFRVELTKIRKYKNGGRPSDVQNISVGCDNIKDKSGTAEVDEITHCPISGGGPVTSHI